MTLREKQRIRRIIESNTHGYEDARRAITLAVMRGAADEAALSKARWDLTVFAMSVAEASAKLLAHAEAEEER
jgi:hypothetical protein